MHSGCPVCISGADPAGEQGLCPCLVVHRTCASSVLGEVQVVIKLHNCSAMLEF